MDHISFLGSSPTGWTCDCFETMVHVHEVNCALDATFKITINTSVNPVLIHLDHRFVRLRRCSAADSLPATTLIASLLF